jgi:hypothetical protein
MLVFIAKVSTYSHSARCFALVHMSQNVVKLEGRGQKLLGSHYDGARNLSKLLWDEAGDLIDP